MLLAAFRLPDGTVKVTGRNHDLNALPATYRANPASVEDGFVTTDGRFLTRAQAAGIPREARTAELELTNERLEPSAERQARDELGLDLDGLLAQVQSAVPERGEYPETIYFVGPNNPSDDQVQAWIASLLAGGRLEEGAYSLRWVVLASAVRKPAVDRLRRPRGPLIFLDIDGVLRRNGAPLYELEEDLRCLFEETLRAMPGAEIVISSSWREDFSLTEIRAHFSEDIAARIIGVTPIAQESEHRRYREVLAYLIHSGQKGRPWVAVDDDPAHYPSSVNLILVDPERGLDSLAAARLGETGRGSRD